MRESLSSLVRKCRIHTWLEGSPFGNDVDATFHVPNTVWTTAFQDKGGVKIHFSVTKYDYMVVHMFYKGKLYLVEFMFGGTKITKRDLEAASRAFAERVRNESSKYVK